MKFGVYALCHVQESRDGGRRLETIFGAQLRDDSGRAPVNKEPLLCELRGEVANAEWT